VFGHPTHHCLTLALARHYFNDFYFSQISTSVYELIVCVSAS